MNEIARSVIITSTSLTTVKFVHWLSMLFWAVCPQSVLNIARLYCALAQEIQPGSPDCLSSWEDGVWGWVYIGGGKVKFVFTSTVKVFFFTGSLGDSWSEKQYNCLQPAANEHSDWASSYFITFVLPLNIISSRCFHTLCNHVAILTDESRCM